VEGPPELCADVLLCQLSGPGESLLAEQPTGCGLAVGFLSAAEAEVLVFCLFAAWHVY